VPWRGALALLIVGAAIAVPLALAGVSGGGSGGSPPVQSGAASPKPLLDRAADAQRALRNEGGGTRFGIDLSRPDVMQVGFGRRPRAGLLFDVASGRVLWRLAPERRLPIASLTKMMTALLVVERNDPHERVRITRRATHTPGSAVGVLPRGKDVQLEALLNGLLLVSGNDAAVALAQHASGTVPAFVATMNSRAAEMGLSCTHFTTPHGFEDQGNHSCAVDLAALARADMSKPRIRRIVRRNQAILKFPIKGGRLFLYNHNPLVRGRFPGVTGLKTGYTDRAGQSIVATARRGHTELGVVLLHSYNSGAQAEKLLDRGFKALRAQRP
jgi:serine-type D-Ala-D-Ala carboxypeptidase (penicillin-binding protein 5/6)